MQFKNSFILLLICAICAIFTGCAGKQTVSSTVTEQQAPSLQGAVSENTASTSSPIISGQIDMAATHSQHGNTPNLECFSVSEIADGALAGQKDNFGVELYDADTFRAAIEEGRVLEGVGSSFNNFGIAFTLEDVWYETSTANMQDNFYEISTSCENPIYIFMKLKAQNTTDKDATFYLNSSSVTAYPKMYPTQNVDFLYQDKVLKPVANNHDYGVGFLPVGESATYTVAYEAGEGFATYDPVYLTTECIPADFPMSAEMPAYVWIKLPKLEKR